MNKEKQQQQNEELVIESYFSALEEAEKQEHKGQQTGAWAIAHFVIQTQMSFDESVTAVREALKKRITDAKKAGKRLGFTEAVVKNSLPLVPFACHVMTSGDTIPPRDRWPTKREAENILLVSGKTPADCLDTWSETATAVRKEAVAEIELFYSSKDLPDKKATAQEVKDKIQANANAKRERSSGSAAGLMDNKEKLVEKIKLLTVPQIQELVGFVNAELDRRCYVTNFYEVSKDEIEQARKK